MWSIRFDRLVYAHFLLFLWVLYAHMVTTLLYESEKCIGYEYM